MQDFITHNEYLTGNRANSLINRKMIFRILGILLFIEGGLFYYVQVFPCAIRNIVIFISFIQPY